MGAKKKKKEKPVYITVCDKCGKPVFACGLCQKHYDEVFFKDDLPTHNDWRLT